MVRIVTIIKMQLWNTVVLFATKYSTMKMNAMYTRRNTMKSNCLECGKEIVYGLFADEYSEITQYGLCSNAIDGCYEKQQL